MQTITIPNKFRDSWFASCFGAEIQAKFLLRDQVVEIDFSNCAWIDPIPMLALLCHVKRWAATVDTPDLTINLGSAAVHGFQDDISRARLFIVKHGFPNAFVDACRNAVFEYESGLDGMPNKFSGVSVENLADAVDRSTSVALYYAPQAAFPPKEIGSPYDGSRVSEFVDSLVQMVDDNLFRARRSEFQHRDSALVRLRQIATEIVGNACEHAYPTDTPGPVYVYARLRQHKDHISVQPATEKVTDVETKGDSPLIQHIQDVTGDRYLEFFVCDIGNGLGSDADYWYANTSDTHIRAEFTELGSNFPKFPLRKLLSMVFRLPVSRHKRNVETATVFRGNVTGLAHVNTVLSQHSDRSRIFVSPEWTAGEHPRPLNYQGGPSDPNFVVTEAEGTAPTGSYFHFAIDVTASELPLEAYWLKPLEKKPEFSTAQNKKAFAESEFFKLRESFKPSPTVVASEVFDLRLLLQKTVKHKPATDEAISRDWQQYLASSGLLSVVRMSRDFRKNLTDRIISYWATKIDDTKPPATLAFCDLSQEQAILLKDHLTRVKLTLARQPSGTAPLAEVTVVAENLISCVLELRHSGTANNWVFRVREDPPIAEEVIPILCSVRRHDSLVFWKRVALLCTKVQLLIQDVHWSKKTTETAGIKLPVYLDYSLAVQDRELAKIVRRSLRRALSAFPELKVYSVDELIKPDLDDALRWSQREPVDTIKESLFVISSIVSGSTVALATRLRGWPEAVLGGFFVETCPPTPYPSNYFATLDWQPPPDISLPLTTKHWERVPGTPYVRPFLEKLDEKNILQQFSFVRSVARNFVERKPGKNTLPSVTQSYDEWHRDKLLKVGHWSVDRRHGLLEIDHTRALQISAESRQGYYNWLVAELNERVGRVTARLLVYPASRLNAIMIRHLLKLPGFDAQEWDVLPINYLPDVGDGLRQMAPLTTEQVRKADAARLGGVAVFIDIGFVGNRTFRHTARQLRVQGVKKVIGMGLVNRTSYPALTEEMADAEVACYWRIDIPTLNDERSCPVCKGLDALLTLRERASMFQPALVHYINSIRGLWALNEPSLSWWDHGLDPIELPQNKNREKNWPFDKKFGFNPPAKQPTNPPPLDADGVQSMLISHDGEAVAAVTAEHDLWPSNIVTWNEVRLRTSTQAAAYGVEIARTQASPDYPWRLAKQVAEAVKCRVPVDQQIDCVKSGAAVAVEITACHLLLCGGDLTVASREEGATLLLHYLLELEAELINESQDDIREHLRRLRGLATLAFANLDSRTKRLLFPAVLVEISSVRIVNEETCIALMAIISSGEEESNHLGVLSTTFEAQLQVHYDKLAGGKSENQRDAEKLISNYRQITVTEKGIPVQFKNALDFFGPGDSHGKYLIDKKAVEAMRTIELDAVQRGVGTADPNTGWALLRSSLRMAHSLICHGWQSISTTDQPGTLAGGLFKALCSLDSTTVGALQTFSKIATPSDFDPIFSSKFEPEKNPKYDLQFVEELTACGINIPTTRDEIQEKAEATIDSVRVAFQESLYRYCQIPPSGNDDRVFETYVNSILGLPQDEDSKQNVKVRFSWSNFSRKQGMRYLLLGKELLQLIQKLKDEALQHSHRTPCEAPKDFLGGNEVALLWVNVVGSSSGELDLTFWNRGTSESDVNDFKSSKEDLAPIHQAIGTLIYREVSTDRSGNRWFSTRISFYWIAGGQK